MAAGGEVRVEQLPSDRSVTLASLRRVAATGVAGVSFWLAVFLPLLYIPMVLTGGVPGGDVAVLVVLVGVNIVAVWFGHRYRS